MWIRDQCYAGQAVAAAGPHPLLDDAVRFVTTRLLEHGPALAPAYTTVGTAVPDERTLDLPGYPGGMDVAGNRVTRQFQLDAFGESLLLLAAAARHGRLNSDARAALRVAAGAIERRRAEPDAGLWELDPRRWAHSRLICAAGLHAVASAGGRAAGSDVARWTALADELVASAGDCVHPTVVGGGERSALPGVSRLLAGLEPRRPVHGPVRVARIRVGPFPAQPLVPVLRPGQRRLIVDEVGPVRRHVTGVQHVPVRRADQGVGGVLPHHGSQIRRFRLFLVVSLSHPLALPAIRLRIHGVACVRPGTPISARSPDRKGRRR